MKRRAVGENFHTEIHKNHVVITYYENTDTYSIWNGSGDPIISTVTGRYGILFSYNYQKIIQLDIPHFSNTFDVVSDIARMFYDYGFFPSYKEALITLVKNYEYIDYLNKE